jgi:hypothetical protein
MAGDKGEIVLPRFQLDQHANCVQQAIATGKEIFVKGVS